MDLRLFAAILLFVALASFSLGMALGVAVRALA
jgi:hypothetical protein